MTPKGAVLEGERIRLPHGNPQHGDVGDTGEKAARQAVINIVVWIYCKANEGTKCSGYS